MQKFTVQVQAIRVATETLKFNSCYFLGHFPGLFKAIFTFNFLIKINFHNYSEVPRVAPYDSLGK